MDAAKGIFTGRESSIARAAGACFLSPCTFVTTRMIKMSLSFEFEPLPVPARGGAGSRIRKAFVIVRDQAKPDHNIIHRESANFDDKAELRKVARNIVAQL